MRLHTGGFATGPGTLPIMPHARRNPQSQPASPREPAALCAQRTRCVTSAERDLG